MQNRIQIPITLLILFFAGYSSVVKAQEAYNNSYYEEHAIKPSKVKRLWELAEKERGISEPYIIIEDKWIFSFVYTISLHYPKGGYYLKRHWVSPNVYKEDSISPYVYGYSINEAFKTEPYEKVVRHYSRPKGYILYKIAEGKFEEMSEKIKEKSTIYKNFDPSKTESECRFHYYDGETIRTYTVHYWLENELIHYLKERTYGDESLFFTYEFLSDSTEKKRIEDSLGRVPKPKEYIMTVGNDTLIWDWRIDDHVKYDLNDPNVPHLDSAGYLMNLEDLLR